MPRIIDPSRASVEAADDKRPHTGKNSVTGSQPAGDPHPSAGEVASWLKFLIDPGQAVELRAPQTPGRDGKPYVRVRHFRADRLDEMACEALELSGRAPGVYVGLNPVRLPLPRKRRAASDEDIVRRRLLLIDCDPERPQDLPDRKVSTTNEEKAAAMKLARAIRDDLTSRGWPLPVVADSGNGAHLLYSIDLPNDEASRDLIQGVLRALASRYDTSEVKIDTQVFNASRHTKLYGTMTCKGPNTAERPHRCSKVLELPKAFTPVPVELLEQLAGETPATVATPVPPKTRTRSAETTNQTDVVYRAIKYINTCEPSIQGENGSARTFKVACKLAGFDLHPDVAYQLLLTHYNDRCVPPWSERELRHKIDDAYAKAKDRGHLLEVDAPPRRNGTPPPARNGNHAARPGSDSATPPNRNDRPAVGDVPDLPVNEAPDDPHRLARAVLAEFHHPEGSKLVWYREAFNVWNGMSNKKDENMREHVVQLVKEEVDRQNREALATHKEQSALDALAPSTGRPSGPPRAVKVTRRLVSDVEQALSSMSCISREPDAPFWIEKRHDDPEPMKIMPAANGLVDLTRDDHPVIRAHTPRFFSTFALPYPFDPSAPPPAAWLTFLSDQWPNDPESIRELQKWFGYLLTPDIDHQKILLLIGPPRSGRSTIKDVMSAIVGTENVASTSPAALADRFGLEPLLGKTLAILGDARAGDTHDAAMMMDRILRISGGDPVEVNRKGKPFLHNVLMRLRFVIISNEVPNFRDASKAIIPRYIPICTPNSFEGREDWGLKAKLLAELPAILNWAIAGRSMLREDGRFIPPPSADDVLNTARSLASPIAEFVADRCVLAPGEETTVQQLWEAWKAWCLENGHQPGHVHLFGRNLHSGTGFKVQRVRPTVGESRVRSYRGIGMKPPTF